MIKQIVSFWTKTYRESRFLFWIELIGTVTSMISAVILATTGALASHTLVWIFIGYLIGSISFQYSSWKRNAEWMFVLMTFYTAMNLIGLWVNI